MTAPPGFQVVNALSNLMKHTAFEPLLTGPLLLYTLRLIPQVPDHLLPTIFNSITPHIDRSKATTILATLFGLGLLRKANDWLSDQVVNNWTSDEYDWSKEIVVVTGGSSGLGELVTKKLSSRGIKVVIIDIVKPKYELSPTTTFFKCDLSSPTAIAQTCSSIRSQIGDPTILLNNAGIASGKTLLETPVDEYQKMFSINTISHFLLTREFLPSMIAKNHGHIITIASMASFVTIAWNVSYSQVKSSALAFHEGLTQELRHIYGAKKVRTSIFHPTWIYTPLIAHITKLRGWREPTLQADDVAEAIFRRIISGRSRQEILPKGYATAAGLRGTSAWLQEGVRDMGARIGKAIEEEGGFVVPERKEDDA